MTDEKGMDDECHGICDPSCPSPAGSWEDTFDREFSLMASGYIKHLTHGAVHDDYHLMCVKDFIRSLLAYKDEELRKAREETLDEAIVVVAACCDCIEKHDCLPVIRLQELKRKG